VRSRGFTPPDRRSGFVRRSEPPQPECGLRDVAAATRASHSDVTDASLRRQRAARPATRFPNRGASLASRALRLRPGNLEFG
jgi:hypothetical protein